VQIKNNSLKPSQIDSDWLEDHVNAIEGKRKLIQTRSLSKLIDTSETPKHNLKEFVNN